MIAKGAPRVTYAKPQVTPVVSHLSAPPRSGLWSSITLHHCTYLHYLSSRLDTTTLAGPDHHDPLYETTAVNKQRGWHRFEEPQGTIWETRTRLEDPAGVMQPTTLARWTLSASKQARLKIGWTRFRIPSNRKKTSIYTNPLSSLASVVAAAIFGEQAVPQWRRRLV